MKRDSVFWAIVSAGLVLAGSALQLRVLAVASARPANLARTGPLQPTNHEGTDAFVVNIASVPNLLQSGDFEDYFPPTLGPPGWISDNPRRQVPAKSETNQPHSGRQNGACWTPEFLDCGLYQEVIAPVTGAYTLRLFAAADRPGGLVGASLNGQTVTLQEVTVRNFGDYAEYTMPFSAHTGDAIAVWMYSPPTPGYVVIDDVSVTLDQPPASGGFLEKAGSQIFRTRFTRNQILGFLPANEAKGIFKFPAPYGTSAVRLTNADDCGGTDCLAYVGYSYWRNTNNHVGRPQMLIFLGLDRSAGGPGPSLLSYDKSTDEVQNLGPLFPDTSTFSYATGEGWYFSGSQPTKLYAYLVGTATLRRYDVLSHQFDSPAAMDLGAC